MFSSHFFPSSVFYSLNYNPNQTQGKVFESLILYAKSQGHGPKLAQGEWVYLKYNNSRQLSISVSCKFEARRVLIGLLQILTCGKGYSSVKKPSHSRLHPMFLVPQLKKVGQVVRVITN